MAYQVRRLLAHNAGRIAAMKEDLQKVTEVLAKANPDNVEAQENMPVSEVERRPRFAGYRSCARAGVAAGGPQKRQHLGPRDARF